MDHHHRYLLPDLATEPISRRRCSPSWIRRSRCRSSSWCRSTSTPLRCLRPLATSISSCATTPPTPPDFPVGSGTCFRLSSCAWVARLWPLPQRLLQLLVASRLARHPTALPAAAAVDPAATAVRPPSQRPPPSASAAPDRSRDAGHATLGPPRDAALAGTPRCRTLAAGLLRVRQVGTIVGRSNADAS